MLKKYVFFVLLIIALFVLMTPVTYGDEFKSGGVIKVAISANLRDLDPHVYRANAKETAMFSIYKSLVGINKDGELVPEIAEHWEITDEGYTYIFHIRENAYFHNGEPVTATDVKFSFERIRDPKTGALLKDNLKYVDSIEIIDEKTLKLQMNQSDAALLTALTRSEAAIVSKEWTENNDIKIKAMGAGPFKFVEWKEGIYLRVEKDTNYYKEDLPRVDHIDFIPIPDDEARINALRAGDVDIADYIPFRYYSSLENDPDIEMIRKKGPIMSIEFNVEREPFNNPKVRRALGYAVDRDALAKTAFLGEATPHYGPQTDDSIPWAYNHDLQNYFSYNPEKAKKMLAEAGYPDGFEATLLSTETFGFYADTAVVIADQLNNNLGCNIKLDLPEWSIRVEKAYNKNYDFAVSANYHQYPDPDGYRDFVYTREEPNIFNSANFSDPIMDYLLDTGREEIDQNIRKIIYKLLEERFLELSPQVLYVARHQGFAHRKNIGGYNVRPGQSANILTGHTWDTVWVK